MLSVQTNLDTKPSEPIINSGFSDKDQLKFLTCGSVDDGKSTLLGRLLYDSKNVFDDQESATRSESRKYGTHGDELDLALLIDGLQAEREQGITIDVAYRYFETSKRKFIAADTPGHEQYTRNMVTGASNCDLAVILVDARHGLTSQTRRHSYIVSLLGIRHVVLAINKMDLIDYDQDIFQEIEASYRQFTDGLELLNVESIPISALNGDNVCSHTEAMPWYIGPALLELLEDIDIGEQQLSSSFRLPIQWVNRPTDSFRGFSGTITSGTAKTGMPVTASLSQQTSTVKNIIGPSGNLSAATAGQAVTLVLSDEIDISRGDIIAAQDSIPHIADQLNARVICLDTIGLQPKQSYIIKLGTATASAQISKISYKTNIDNLEKTAADKLGMNEIGHCQLSLDRPLAFDPYVENQHGGSFIVIDKLTNKTIAAGTIEADKVIENDIHWHQMVIDKPARAEAKGQKPCVLWFTGLSGAGKSTIADQLEQELYASGRHTVLLDGDNVRHGLNNDLAFSDEDRVENIRRVAEVSKLMAEAGLIVLVSFISPFRSERQMARDLMEAGEFIEIFVDTPLAVCEERDPKGLYKKARAGQIKNFTGIDSKYERPDNPEITLNAGAKSVSVLVDDVIGHLIGIGRI